MSNLFELTRIPTDYPISKVFWGYEKFLLYIEDQDLLEVCSLRPLINGRDISATLGVKAGPWMNRAIEMVIAWQLRNPGRSDGDGAMDEIINRREELDFNVKPKS